MSKSPAKLHSVLAVEASLESKAKKLALETLKTFKKQGLFKGLTRTLLMFDPEESRLNTTESVKLETTVDEVVKYITPHIANYWDAVLQKDATNQTAIADLVVGDAVIAKDIPATFLLGLEKKLQAFRLILEEMPTLPPSVVWELDPQQEPGVFVNKNDDTQIKTTKDVQPRVLYEATKEHPAQVEKLNVTRNIGTYTTRNWCGMLTPLKKAQRLNRLDKVLEGVKLARARANEALLIDSHIGSTVINFILEGEKE